MVNQIPLAGPIWARLWPYVAVLGGITLLILLKGRLGRSLLQALERVMEVCQKLLTKCLHPELILSRGREALALSSETGEEEPQDDTGSEVFMIVTRLLGLAFTLDVLLALLILDGNRTGLVIFQSAASSGTIPLPFSVGTIMGLLGWSMIVLMGSFLLEVVMKRMPPGVEFLLPWWREARGSRILFRVLIGFGSVLLFFYVALLGLAAQLDLYHVHWAAASVIVATLQMILANLVGVFSLWILVLGVGALIGAVLLTVQLICAILHVLLRAWVNKEKKQPIVLGATNAMGGVSGDGAWAGPGAQGVWLEGGKWEQSVGRAGGSDEQSFVLPNAAPAAYKTSIVAAGDFGRRYLFDSAEGLASLQGKGLVRTAGYCPTGRPPGRELGEAVEKAQAVNVGMTPKEMALIRQMGGNEVELAIDRQLFKLQEQIPKTAGQELIFVGLDWNLVPAAVGPMARLAGVLKRQVIVPVVEIPAAQLHRSEVVSSLELLRKAWDEKAIHCAILTDRQGPATANLVRERQGRFLARTLNGLVVAHQCYEENPTGAQALSELGSQAPFLSLSVGSTSLPTGSKLGVLDPGRWLTGGARGRGDAEQTRTSIQALGDRVNSDRESQLFPLPEDANRQPLCGVVFIPFNKNDQRFLDVCEDTERWAATFMPNASMVFIAGPGEEDVNTQGHYFAQWSWLYGFDLEQLLGSVALQAKSSVASPQPKSSRRAPAAQGDGEDGAAPRKRGHRTPLRLV